MADVISIAPARSIAAVTAYRDVARTREALRAHFGAAPPITAGWIDAVGLRLSCLAPDRFLVQGSRNSALAAKLAPLLDGHAAVTDQSDLWHTVAITAAADLLARIVPVDLDLAAFPPGHLALTRGFHVDVRLWRLAERDWELAVVRSHAAYIAHALESSVVVLS